MMAKVVKIDAINPIPGADAIEVATVGGWKVVVKNGEFTQGDLAIYCEIDSWIPYELASFLSKGQEPREYNGVKGERLRTVKLRNQISQGLLLSTNVLGSTFEIGADVSEQLGIQKWEATIPVQLAGEVQGVFPSMVPRTDQERIQNLTENLANLQSLEYEITEKLDGTSCTFYKDLDGELHVCSRNFDLKESATNTYWKMVTQLDLHNRMSQLSPGIAIQGEIIGEGIQSNLYKIAGQRFFVFDIYNVNKGRYESPEDRTKICQELGLDQVPVMSQTSIAGLSIEDILMFAEGKSVLNKQTEREGLVFKCKNDPNIHFKAISNRFLIKNGD